MTVPNGSDLAPAFVLASVLTSYPDTGFAGSLRTLLQDPGVTEPLENLAQPDWRRLKPQLERFLAEPGALDDLRSEYIELFDRGRTANPLYETEYGRRRALAKGGELVDIAGFYHAFGLELGADAATRDMPDHVAIELEFYALLLLKEITLATDADGAAIVRDGRRKFLNDHLGRFVSAIADRPGVRASTFYAPAFACCRALVEAECRRLGVVPEPVDWADEAESDEMACGSGGCVG